MCRPKYPILSVLLYVLAIGGSLPLDAHYRNNPDEATRPPQILREPNYTVVPTGGDGSLFVYAIGAGELSHQWFRNHEPIDGEIANILTISDATIEDSGFYHVEITSAFGAAVSEIVRLKVEDPENIRGVERDTTGDQSNMSMLEWSGGFFIVTNESGERSRSADGGVWEELEPVPGTESVLEIVASENRAIFVLEGGKLASTQDFINWDVVQIDEASESIMAVVSSLGIIAALVDLETHARLLTSVDGTEWEAVHDFPKSTQCSSCIPTLSATKDFILATAGWIGEEANMALTNNGEEWTIRNNADLPQSVEQMSFDDVVALRTGSGAYLLTRDGNEYESVSWSFDQAIEKAVQIEDVYYALGVFNAVYRSTDLIAWEKVWDEFPNSIDPPYDITPEYPDVDLTFASGNGTVLIGPIDGSFYPVKDFETFRPPKFPKRRDTLSPLLFEGIEFVNEQFVIRKHPDSILVSEDGSRWRELFYSSTLVPSYSPIGEYAYGNGYFVKGATRGASIQNMNWYGLPDNLLEFRQLVFGNDTFVGIAEDKAYYSTDGLDWKFATNVEPVADLASADGRFLAIEEGGRILVSNDGVAWSRIELPLVEIGSTVNSSHLMYGNERYIASIGNELETIFFESSDGFNWTKMEFDPSAFFPPEVLSQGLIDMAWGDGRFLLLFEDRVFESADFAEWDSFVFDTDSLFELQFGAGTFVAIGREGRIVQFGVPIGTSPYTSIRNTDSIYARPNEKLEITVEAYHPDGIEGGVELYENGKLVQVIMDPPYIFDWSASYSGQYTLSARARGSDGISSIDTIEILLSQQTHAKPRNDQYVRLDNLVVFQDTAFAVGDDGYVYRSVDARDWRKAFLPHDGDQIESLELGDGFIYSKAYIPYYVSWNAKDWIRLRNRTSGSYSQLGNWLSVSGYSLDTRGWIELEWTRDFLNWNSYDSIPGAFPRDLENRFNQSDVVLSPSMNPNSTEYIMIRGPWGDHQRIAPPVDFWRILDAKLIDNSIYSLFQVGLTVELWTIGEGLPWSKLGEFAKPALGGVGFDKVGNLSIVRSTEFDFYKLSIDGFQTHKDVSGRIESVVYDNDRYVGLVDAVLSYSNNGVDWIQNAKGLGGYGSLWLFQNQFLADLGDQGIFISNDGNEWESVYTDLDYPKELRDFAFDGDRFVGLFGRFSENKLGFSPDGESWEFFSEPRIDGSSIIFANGELIATGRSKNVYISKDGVGWVEIEVDASVDGIGKILQVPGSGLFVLETRDEVYWTSSDARNWTSRTWKELAFEDMRAEGDFLFATATWLNSGLNVGITEVYRSADGIEWSRVPELVSSRDVFFENGTYLARTRKGKGSLIRSLDGINWEVVDHPISKTSMFLRAVDNAFHVSLSDGSGFVSSDGLTWHRTAGNEIPLLIIKGENGNRYSISGSNMFIPSNVDLSLEVSSGIQASELDTENLELEVSVTNRGKASLNLEGMTIAARLSENDNWTDAIANRLEKHVLLDRELESGDQHRYKLSFDIPVELVTSQSTIQLLLNPEQSVSETNLANNYAWLRLLPAPEISVEEVDSSSVEINWSREGGYVKRIEYSYDLKNWFLMEAPPIDAESGSISETLDPARRVYIRVEAE